ncbi:MAG: ABC transporter substrate-binding protein [Clostridiales bacterium]|nr:ABC transporter substrate-binding protein [Clostridiales bacterium]
MKKRSWKKTFSALGVTALMTATTVFSTACDSRKELVVYNWGEYIAEDTISKFEKAFPQYKLVYRTFENNESMYPNLSNSYDVIIPSEYMVARLLREDRIQELDWSKLPNVTQYMDPMFKTVTYSQDKEISDIMLNYAVPYLYCTVGLVYDANRVDIPEDTTDPKEVWGVLFDDQYRNQIGMYDSMRESIGVALNYCGYSINTLDAGELEEAKQLLLDQKSRISPSRGVDNLKDKMASGELAASVAWSGDHVVILDRIDELGKSDEIDMRYILPAGSNWSVDMMCVPTNAKNVDGAHDFINYMYDPDIALANCEFVGYSTPNTAARAMLDPEVANNLSYYPDEATFATLEVYFSSSEYEEKYTEIWNTIGASS